MPHIDQTNTIHTPVWRTSYGVVYVSNLEKYDRVINSFDRNFEVLRPRDISKPR